jgi:glycerol transport system substrate-binding protein
VSKTVSLKKSHVGLTIIRDSDIKHASFSERAPKLGGLVEFYRSPARVMWTPSGTNVPDYPKLAQLWWQNIGEAVSGSVTADRAMDNLAAEMDKVMARLERAKVQGDCGPKLNKEEPEAKWLGKGRSPKAKLDNEKPKGETVQYETLLKAWKEGRVR